MKKPKIAHLVWLFSDVEKYLYLSSLSHPADQVADFVETKLEPFDVKDIAVFSLPWEFCYLISFVYNEKAVKQLELFDCVQLKGKKSINDIKNKLLDKRAKK